ncbi:hypothetical protein [Halalkalibacter akibai]|uniref:Lipoprotein n=1 Tax=Halalkalibacter akibai (strain ATCC 43226 / DSM 21942 / CIP 109018 / JCM 9157 / 1139) TaxID=1236973 RepID=W4R015_HALA3|nr:hypothetical protein [Halalkalibacter akibai]GAE37725.1 lipoprotein [Halalkalibacter akibai JCM 9157]
MIKGKNSFAIPLLIGLITLVGCSASDIENDQLVETKKTVQDTTITDDMLITVEERTDDGYKTVKVLENSFEMKKVEEILENANWEENVFVSMTTPPEYRLRINPSNYAVWVTPNGDRLEIVIEGEAKYIKLPEKVSETLFELITDDKLN